MHNTNFQKGVQSNQNYLKLDLIQSKNRKLLNWIAKEYDPLDYKINLNKLIKGLLHPVFDLSLTKYDLHKLINCLLINNYHGEEVLKYNLAQIYLKRKGVVGAFEVNVDSSRLDFLAINGHTSSFEIKSELDDLTKLNKQINDYLKVFEYNYLVIDEKHLERAKILLPESYGIWVYKKGKYTKIRTPILNTNINPLHQLKTLTSKERSLFFKTKTDDLENIVVNNSPTLINQIFKRALKTRYKSRWEFICVNNEGILPLDIQFFFNNNVYPIDIYS